MNCYVLLLVLLQDEFEILTSQFELENKKILDLGCGFGDLNSYLKNKGIHNYEYLGVDIVDELIKEARVRNSLNKQAKIEYVCEDFLKKEFHESFDYVISSGVFNRKFSGELDNYTFILKCLDKAFNLCRGGVAFDFLSDRVDYQYQHTFHSSPMKILEMAYKLSRNIILRNDYMPFEFSIVIFKDDSFSKEDTLFTKYKNSKYGYYQDK